MIGTKSFGLLYRSKTAVLESINHEGKIALLLHYIRNAYLDDYPHQTT